MERAITLAGYSPWGHKELDTTKQARTPLLFSLESARGRKIEELTVACKLNLISRTVVKGTDSGTRNPGFKVPLHYFPEVQSWASWLFSMSPHLHQHNGGSQSIYLWRVLWGLSQFIYEE